MNRKKIKKKKMKTLKKHNIRYRPRRTYAKVYLMTQILTILN